MGVYQEVWIGDDEPSTQPIGSNESLWFKPSENQWYSNHSGSWVAVPFEVDGEVGIDTEVTAAGITLKFKGGILYSHEEV